LPAFCGGKSLSTSKFGNVMSSKTKAGGPVGRKSTVKSVTNPLNKAATNANYEEEGDEAETGNKMAGGGDCPQLAD
jgi:hypothetical protein